ncbi:hypothetical protein QJS66_04475 [Kocuria rhizophila]|nr:hypothetical protein QJS66_04475 [Kocuria rhizophila]
MCGGVVLRHHALAAHDRRRDEPHADAQHYRRLHVITAELEHVPDHHGAEDRGRGVAAHDRGGAGPSRPRARGPASALRQSRTTYGHRPLELADGSTRSALELQRGSGGRLPLHERTAQARPSGLLSSCWERGCGRVRAEPRPHGPGAGLGP